MVLFCSASEWVLELQENTLNGDLSVTEYEYDLYLADNREVFAKWKTRFIENQYRALQQKKADLEKLICNESVNKSPRFNTFEGFHINDTVTGRFKS